LSLLTINNPVFRAFDDNGNPLSGGRVYFYRAGTSTPAAVYTNVNETDPHTNPIVLDSRGEALIYGRGYFKVIIEDADGVVIDTIDNFRILDLTDYAAILLSMGNAEENLDLLGVDRGKIHKHSYQLTPPDLKPPETPNGTRTGFSTREYFVESTLVVYVNGQRQIRNLDYTEDDDKKGYAFSFAIRSDENVQHEYIVKPTSSKNNVTSDEVATTSARAYPPGFISGFKIEWVSGAIINVNAGSCRDADNDVDITLSEKINDKVLARPWSAKSEASVGGNALDKNDDLEPNECYGVFVIRHESSGDVDLLASKHTSGGFVLNMPDGYTAYRRIGCLLTDDNADIIDFTQRGDEFYFKQPQTAVAPREYVNAERNCTPTSDPVNGFVNTYVLANAPKIDSVVKCSVMYQLANTLSARIALYIWNPNLEDRPAYRYDGGAGDNMLATEDYYPGITLQRSYGAAGTNGSAAAFLDFPASEDLRMHVLNLDVGGDIIGGYFSVYVRGWVDKRDAT
jgi:hypothetical protein